MKGQNAFFVFWFNEYISICNTFWLKRSQMKSLFTALLKKPTKYLHWVKIISHYLGPFSKLCFGKKKEREKNTNFFLALHILGSWRTNWKGDYSVFFKFYVWIDVFTMSNIVRLTTKDFTSSYRRSKILCKLNKRLHKTIQFMWILATKASCCWLLKNLSTIKLIKRKFLSWFSRNVSQSLNTVRYIHVFSSVKVLFMN